MDITPETRVRDLLRKYPFLKEYLAGLSPSFAALDNPVLRRTVGRVATLSRAAAMAGMGLDELQGGIAGEIARRTGERLEVQGEGGAPGGGRLEDLKGIIRELHGGRDPAELKRRFRGLLRDVAPWEIARMEQSLIAEGLPEEEVKGLCGLHVEIFRESLDSKTVPGLPAGHPVHTFMRENREAERIVAEMETAARRGDAGKLRDLLDRLGEIDRHYLRKENQLFPVLESRGISGPSKVMWVVDDDIRKAVRDLREAAAAGEADGMKVQALAREIRDMIYKEEHILFPMALEALTEEDWARVAAGEGEAGYAWVEPAGEWRPGPASFTPLFSSEKAGSLNLDTGQLTAEQVNLLLTHLPVDISFVNEKDEVVYYSGTPERIFPRSPGIIGRRVQNCHPPGSVALVERILGEFRSGRKDAAEFWIRLRGRFVHIRYFAVRDREGSYRGTLEVSQDVTAIRALEGERRLLGWEEPAP